MPERFIRIVRNQEGVDAVQLLAEVPIGPVDELTLLDQRQEDKFEEGDALGPQVIVLEVEAQPLEKAQAVEAGKPTKAFSEAVSGGQIEQPPPPEEDENQASEELEDKTVKELEKIASQLDIPGRSSMNRDELIEAIRARQT